MTVEKMDGAPGGQEPAPGGRGARVAIGMAMVAVVAAGFGWVATQQPEPPAPGEQVAGGDVTAAVPAPAPTPVPTPATPAPAPSAATPAPAPEAEPVPAPVAPRFDTVRADADGGLQVAGRAAPGAEVLLMADGQEIARTRANARGDFAILAELAAGDAARALQLQALGADGQVVASTQSVFLAPRTAAPVVAAEPGVTTPAAPAAPTVVVAEGAGVEVLAPRAAAKGVTLDSIAYDSDGVVTLAGRGAAPFGESRVMVYLDNALVSAIRPRENGAWQLRMPGLEPGLYTLRIDEVNAAGSVLSRMETPFQRETREVLARALARQAPAVAGEAAPQAGAAAAPAALAAGGPVGGQAPAAGNEANALPGTDPAATVPAAGTATVTAGGDAAPEVPRMVEITVQPGYSLWAIAARNYGDGAKYVQLYEANRAQIRNPDLIYPGQVFTIPQPD